VRGNRVVAKAIPRPNPATHVADLGHLHSCLAGNTIQGSAAGGMGKCLGERSCGIWVICRIWGSYFKEISFSFPY